AFAGGLVGGQEILRAKLVAGALGAFIRVLEGHADRDHFSLSGGRAEHGAAAFVGVDLLRMRHHGAPGIGFDTDHSSSQKCSLRYFSAESQSTVTIVAVSPRATTSLASRVAAHTLQPE